MKYWITTHWPRRIDESADEAHNGVWVPDGRDQVINRMSVGDMVFIYESKGGRTELRPYVDGTIRKIRRRIGREGVVALVCVTDKPHQPKNSRPEKYSDGTTVWWRYHAPTRNVNSGGFIPRRKAASLLGFSEEYVFRGFGEDRSGLKEISKQTFDDLLSAFVERAEEDEKQRVNKAAPFKRGLGGEGPEHLALKNRIANDPATVLSEPGLELWKTEWPLPTGDRIDVVLKDKYDRFVAVEVEVDCDQAEIAGPLQCMKYRAMLSYFFGRPIEEVRTILAAHSIHDTVKQRCDMHSIEVAECRRTII